MNFSADELDFFSGLFSADIIETQQELSQNNLTVKTTVPDNIAHVLGSSKLSLLVELSSYQLWFPISLKLNDVGEFCSNLGTPEIIDNTLNERSWRVKQPKNINIYDQGLLQDVEILSLSNSGLTMRAQNPRKPLTQLKNTELTMSLPDNGDIKITLEKVRTENDILAVKFKHLEQENEQLRKFIFSLHRQQNAELYTKQVAGEVS